jgi:plasmid stabilization system protein ParE
MSDTIAPTSTAPLEPIDASLFREAFNHRPFIIKHRLTDHPLFAVPRLLALARSLPPELVEYNSGELPVSVDRGETPRNGLSAEETIRRIEHCKSWLVLKNVERDAEYGRLLRQCLAQVAEHSELIVPGMCQGEGFIFLSSPNSVTPYHIDPEYNFLLQIRGRKLVHMFNGERQEVLPEESLESFYVEGATRNLAFKDEFRQHEWVNELAPGDGLHFPLTFPHWVQNGPEVSISFSITFRADASNRREVLYRINHRLRRLGVRPAPVGASPWRDGAKYTAFRLMRAAKRLVSRPAADDRSPGELVTTSNTP